MAIVHSFKTCKMASECCDPCNNLGVEFWMRAVKEDPPFPADKVPAIDKCSKLGECRSEPCSIRCYQYRCAECKMWHDKTKPFEHEGCDPHIAMIAAKVCAPDS